jgi:methionyl-tRNA synthetase
MGFEFDYFIRTTQPSHVQQVQEIWNNLESKGYIELGTHEGWYSVSDENFCTETQVQEIEKDGKKIMISTESGQPVEWVAEENFMFKLSAFQDRLLKFYEENPEWIVPSFRQREVEKFVANGLQDLSVSRKKKVCQWAIEVPYNEKHSSHDHCVYVWLDALTNYYTAALERKKDPKYSNQPSCWPADIHVIGKDIVRFHCIYWPAFLMAADLPLPKRIVAHGWWTKDGKKISKSLGNVFDPIEKAAEYGMDALKYFLLRESSFSQDGDYVDRNMIMRLNGELADSLGNLCMRCTSSKINPEAKVPKVPSPEEYTDEDKILVQKINNLFDLVNRHMEHADIQKSLIAIFELLGSLNEFVTKVKPWELVKKDKQRLQTVLYVLIEGLRIVATLLQPYMPDSAKGILDYLNVPQNLRQGKHVFKVGLLPPGTPITEAKVLFTKKEADTQSPTTTATSSTSSSSSSSSKKPQGIAAKENDTVTCLDIRVGRVLSVKRHPDATSLYVEEIDVGEEKPRQVVSGLVQHIPEQHLQGALVLVICNLAPAALRGVTSYGMILVASEAIADQKQEKIELIQVPKDAVVGERVTFPPLQVTSDSPDQEVNKKKLPKVLKHLKTDGNGVVCWKSNPCIVKSGAPCVAPLKNAPVK